MAFATAEALEQRAVPLVREAPQEAWGTSAIFAGPEGNQFVLSSR